MIVTDLALKYLKHLRKLDATADDLWMLTADLELHAIASELQRLADDMELEADSDELREMAGELESVAEELRCWAEGMCETHACKFQQMADELEEAAAMTSFLADELGDTTDELRRLTDDASLAAVADKMRRLAKGMMRDAVEVWPATLMERLRKVGPCVHHAIHALTLIAEAVERDSAAKQREFHTGNWAVA